MFRLGPNRSLRKLIPGDYARRPEEQQHRARRISAQSHPGKHLMIHLVVRACRVRYVLYFRSLRLIIRLALVFQLYLSANDALQRTEVCRERPPTLLYHKE